MDGQRIAGISTNKMRRRVVKKLFQLRLWCPAFILYFLIYIYLPHVIINIPPFDQIALTIEETCNTNFLERKTLGSLK